MLILDHDNKTGNKDVIIGNQLKIVFQLTVFPPINSVHGKPFFMVKMDFEKTSYQLGKCN